MENKVSLFNASETVSNLLELLDRPTEFEEILKEELIKAEGEVSQAIDRRKFVITECDTRIEVGKNMIRNIQEHIKKLATTKDRIKKTTLEVVSSHPDQKYEDSLGRKLTVRTHPGSVQFNIHTERCSLGPCVPFETAKKPEVAPYIIQKSYYQLDTNKILSDLKRGIKLEFASLHQSKYISGL